MLADVCETTTCDLRVKKLPPREEAITAALVHPRTLTPEAYRALRSALPFNEDAMHVAFVALFEALDCDHGTCTCTCGLKNASEDVRRAVAVANTHEREETGLLARTFMSWGRSHCRLERRRDRREELAPPCREGEGDVVTSEVGEEPVNPGELCNLRESCTAPLEAEFDRPVYRAAIGRLFAVAGCSENQQAAFVAINSRDGRDPGNAVPAGVRRAAHVARGKVDSHRAQHGILEQADLDAAIEDGHLFGGGYAMSA